MGTLILLVTLGCAAYNSISLTQLNRDLKALDDYLENHSYEDLKELIEKVD